MLQRIVIAVFGLCFLAACSFSAMDHDPEAVFRNPAAYAETDHVIDFIRNRDAEGFWSTWVAEAEGDLALRRTMTKLFDALPGEGALKIDRFYAELRTGGAEYDHVPVYLSVYDVESGGEFAQLTIAVVPENDACCYTSHASLIPAERRPSTYNDFTLEGKGWVHYLMFALLIFMPVFMIATAVLCFVEKRVSRRWLWIPFILIGFWGVAFNWTTGEVQNDLVNFAQGRLNISFIKLHLLGAGFTTAGYFQPWILTIGSPIGAIVYYFQRRVSKPKGDDVRPYEVGA